MSSFNSDGQCLCGGVRFQVTAAAAKVGLCHCKMCRRWSGGLPLAAISAQVQLQEDKTLTWWKSSGWGARGFCSACGSVLFWRQENGGAWMVSAGVLENEAELAIAEHIFYDDKAAFYAFADETPRKSGAEFTAEVFKMLRKEYGEDFVQQAFSQLRRHSGEGFAGEVEKLLAAD